MLTRRIGWVAGVLLWLLVGMAGAQTTTTTTTLPTFPRVTQPKTVTWGEFDIMTGQTCPTGITCETPMFSAMASDTAVLFVGCTGSCRVKLQCRLPSFPGDVLIADSGVLTDARAVVPLTTACHWIVAQLSGCGGTCQAWSHVSELRGAQ